MPGKPVSRVWWAVNVNRAGEVCHHLTIKWLRLPDTPRETPSTAASVSFDFPTGDVPPRGWRTVFGSSVEGDEHFDYGTNRYELGIEEIVRKLQSREKTLQIFFTQQVRSFTANIRLFKMDMRPRLFNSGGLKVTIQLPRLNRVREGFYEADASVYKLRVNKVTNTAWFSDEITVDLQSCDVVYWNKGVDWLSAIIGARGVLATEVVGGLIVKKLCGL